MSLTVLSVAYPFAPVGDGGVGGAEAMLWALDRALVRAGHRSLVLACTGSSPAGELIATHLPAGPITPARRAQVTAEHRARLLQLLRERPVDLVHMHGIDFASYPIPEAMPALVTLHLPPSWYPKEIWQQPGNVTLQFVSSSQRATAAAEQHRRPLIENGVEPDLAPLARQRDYALVLARICPEKNVAAALDAGTLAGIPVLVGGQVFPYHEHTEYFAHEVAPRLEIAHAAVRHCFLGPLGNARKRRLLRGAKCLLLPTLAPETSSLVAMEALHAGTPVVAYPSGAIPEIVDDGVTGFLVSTPEEMARAMHRLSEIDRQRCRDRARERFSEARMTAEYFGLYRQLLADAGRHVA